MKLRRFLRIFVLSIAGTAVVLAVLLGAAYRASQQVPGFYETALQGERIQQKAAVDELERNVLQLHNDVRDEGRWEAVFTDEQINAWLAVDLVENFPRLLPRGTSSPRVDISPQGAQIACRYESPRVSTVISLGVELYLVPEETNVLAVRVHQARAGALPIPLKKFLDNITKSARRSDVTVRWSQTEGDPVALVTIPSEHDQYQFRRIRLETIEMRDGEVYLSGSTEHVEENVEQSQEDSPLRQASSETDPEKTTLQR